MDVNFRNFSYDKKKKKKRQLGLTERTRKDSPKNSLRLDMLAVEERKLPGAVVEDGRELHLDVGAGADHQQHHGQEGVEVEQRRLAKSDRGT